MAVRVVVVDDSSFMAKQIRDFMEKQMHYEVVGIGADGNEGVNLYRQHQPDLITMDLTMPNKDGKTAIIEILAEFPSAKVLVISAVKGNTMLECVKLGVKGFIEKPLKFADAVFIEDFRNSVQEALES